LAGVGVRLAEARLGQISGMRAARLMTPVAVPEPASGDAGPIASQLALAVG
jgi:hypothetical protein